ncbi:hypothetical protein [Aquimarina sp. AU58]|uniref:hypothetical protein n=1 Tax=Aquimarina sp. AU58 TaxID=1874112 RepID=UPI000D6E44D9|nr:hypothetical protein [Aquimarina sp. AU58]
MKTKKTIIKLIALGTIVLSTILLLKKDTFYSDTNYFASIANEISNIKGISYHFIGSSRVQQSINPKILKEHFGNRNINNLGINGSTFLSNCILADFLMKEKTSKVLFIELSPLKQELPSGFIKFSKEANINILKTIDKLAKNESFRKRLLLKLNILNYLFFKKISVKEDVRRMLSQNDDDKGNIKEMGFISLNESNFNSTSPFISYEEINSPSTKNKNLTSYQNYINYLLELSSENNSKIIFFLPITYRNEKEKNIVIPLYHSLPDSLKIKYSKSFLDSMVNSKYLSDENHLNSLGAKKYTNLLSHLIESSFFLKKQ